MLGLENKLSARPMLHAHQATVSCTSAFEVPLHHATAFLPTSKACVYLSVTPIHVSLSHAKTPHHSMPLWSCAANFVFDFVYWYSKQQNQ